MTQRDRDAIAYAELGACKARTVVDGIEAWCGRIDLHDGKHRAYLDEMGDYYEWEDVPFEYRIETYYGHGVWRGIKRGPHYYREQEAEARVRDLVNRLEWPADSLRIARRPLDEGWEPIG